MDVRLSDLLTCPRCGPEHGLILLPHDVRDRRVAEGVLGCANCRGRYPIVGGVADLRAGRGAARSGGPDAAADVGRSGGVGGREAAIRLAALMGLAETSGVVLVAGPAAVHAAELAALVEGVEVVAIDGVAGPGVTRVLVSSRIPFRTGTMRGVALTGGRAVLLEEGARVLGAGGRLVVEPLPEGGRERLAHADLEVVAEKEGVAVARRPA